MSAQIIRALRVRVEALNGEADRIEAMTGGASELPTTPQQPYARNVHTLRLLAGEFGALADAAEGGRSLSSAFRDPL